ncbi:MAG: hypothetical protein H3C27_12920 [Opitutaceae bacterium]|nr:hypothetical protein [Opitutaceae bacterium]
MAGFCIRSFPSCLLLCAGLAGAPALAADFDSLLQNSPFGRTTTAAQPSSAAPLEFRGIMVEDGIHYFSVRETASARSFWVTLHDGGAGSFVASEYDAANQRLTVDYQGTQLVLALVTPDHLVAPPASAARPPPPATASARPAAGPSSSPEAEAERLRNIAEEIKRRRALRQQAINNTPPVPQP